MNTDIEKSISALFPPPHFKVYIVRISIFVSQMVNFLLIKNLFPTGLNDWVRKCSWCWWFSYIAIFQLHICLEDGFVDKKQTINCWDGWYFPSVCNHKSKSLLCLELFLKYFWYIEKGIGNCGDTCNHYLFHVCGEMSKEMISFVLEYLFCEACYIILEKNMYLNVIVCAIHNIFLNKIF